MKTLLSLTKRNIKLFFKDKGMFFSALITPIILLVLYATFLQNVYKSSFTSSIPKGFKVVEDLINGCVGGQLFSSLLAVCCVTVSFCANLIMVQDRANGSVNDLRIAPLKRSTLTLSYYFATVINTLIISGLASIASFIYISQMGWYLSLADVFCIILDIILLVLFGTALSSIICFPLSTQGQMSAVGTIVSAGYGFICGAYMPISQFGDSLQKVLSFLPGTYGTSLIRNHALRGVFEEMDNSGFPKQLVEGIKDSIDCNLYFFGEKVSVNTMYLIMTVTVVALIAILVVINLLHKGARKA